MSLGTEELDERVEAISWLELFFDLVVVAAVGVFTEGLRADPSWSGVGLTMVLYATIWVSWSLTVLYANVARELTEVRTISITMFLVAIMAAAAPIHDAHRANLFAGAFLILRVIVSRGSLITGRVLASWPMLQFGGMAAPWLVSLWVHPPVKYWLWAAGLVLDLILVSGRKDPARPEALARMQERMDHEGHGKPVPTLVPVEVNRTHLDERLGLFVIIVLGESVIQLVHAAAVTPWTRSFESIALASFVLLLGLWRHTLGYGFTGAPHTSLAELPPRFGLPLHLLSTAGLVGIAAGLAQLLEDPTARLGTPAGWLLGGGMVLHFGVTLVAGIAGRASRRWVLGWAAPCTAYGVVVGLLGPHLDKPVLAWVATVPALWLLFVRKPPSGAVTRVDEAAGAET